jgi:ribonuclease HII
MNHQSADQAREGQGLSPLLVYFGDAQAPQDHAQPENPAQTHHEEQSVRYRLQRSVDDWIQNRRTIAGGHQDDRAGVRTLLDSARARALAEKRERQRTQRLYTLECELRAQGCSLVAGVDEVGRGALAGPLTAAAVVLPDEPRIEGLDDSKRLTPQRREELAVVIREHAVAVGVAHVSAGEIDSLGMTAALRLAMGHAIEGLGVTVDHVVLDGLPMRVVENETAVVKGDSKVAAVAAASIIAKVTRDALMRSLAPEHPEYSFEINKGYGTPEHLAVIGRVGLSSIHRRSFTIGGGTGSLF